MDDNDVKKARDADRGANSKQVDAVLKARSKEDTRKYHETRQGTQSRVGYVTELTNAARDAMDETAQQTWDAMQTLIAPVADVFTRAEGEEGTELRKYLGLAREHFNRQLDTAQVQLQDVNKFADDQLVPIKSALGIAQKRRNFSSIC